MLLKIGEVFFHQRIVPTNDQPVLRALLLRRLREVERAGDQRSPVDGPYAPESYSP